MQGGADAFACPTLALLCSLRRFSREEVSTDVAGKSRLIDILGTIPRLSLVIKILKLEVRTASVVLDNNSNEPRLHMVTLKEETRPAMSSI